MRRELQYAVSALADPDFQMVVWQRGQLPRPNYAYELDAALHAILDDTSVLDDPMTMVGAVLVDEVEAMLLAHLATELAQMIEDLGADAPQSAFLSAPRWPDVLRIAKEAQSRLGVPRGFP